MAVKKVVASLQKGAGKTYSKVIRMVKSEKTGAYKFVEEIIPNDIVTDYFKNNNWNLDINKNQCNNGLYQTFHPIE